MHPRVIRNLSLVGFMGTGKSTVGRLVAEQLRFGFLDTDEMIEVTVGDSIAEIFRREGENNFRTMERNAVMKLETLDKTVIATGGGLVIDPANLQSLKRHSLVVCLWASAEAIWERVRHQSHRPLLQGENPMEKMRKLLAQREPFYRQADVLVNTDLRPIREVVPQVLHHFYIARHTAA